MNVNVGKGGNLKQQVKLASIATSNRIPNPEPLTIINYDNDQSRIGTRKHGAKARNK